MSIERSFEIHISVVVVVVASVVAVVAERESGSKGESNRDKGVDMAWANIFLVPVPGWTGRAKSDTGPK